MEMKGQRGLREEGLPWPHCVQASLHQGMGQILAFLPLLRAFHSVPRPVSHPLPVLSCCLPPPHPWLLPCSGVSLGAQLLSRAQAAHCIALALGTFSNRQIIASVNCNLILAIFL